MNRWMQFQLFWRSFFLQTGWNFAKYQNLGLAFVMSPFLHSVYKKDKQDLPSVLERYLDSFNTQPMMASFCFGALAKQEERMARAKTLADYRERLSEWNSLKRSLSITTASLGDRLFWGTLKPFTLLLAIFIWLMLDINFFEATPQQSLSRAEVFGACFVAFFTFNAIALFVKWKGIDLSYNAPNNGCFGLTQFDWNRTIYNTICFGMILAAGLLLGGLYYFLHDLEFFLGLKFITRAVIVLFFVSISLMTRDLRIPNMYLYIAAMLVFNIVYLF